MNMQEVLVHFGKDQLKVLGRKEGGKYIAACLPVWTTAYGQKITEAVARELREELKRMSA